MSISKKKNTIKKNNLIKLLINSIVLVILLISLFSILRIYLPIFWAEVVYAYNNIFNHEYRQNLEYLRNIPKKYSHNDILLYPVNKIPEPADRDFSIIIPKINVNRKVIKNVDISNELEVEDALKQGIAWAKGTVEPGEWGNSLIFSHSASNTWNMARYNAEFTLLNKLELDDFFTIFYKDRQLDFIVFDKQILDPDDKSYITAIADGRIVTLQTCYPPGNDTKRLIVRGRLFAMELK